MGIHYYFDLSLCFANESTHYYHLVTSTDLLVCLILRYLKAMGDEGEEAVIYSRNDDQKVINHSQSLRLHQNSWGTTRIHSLRTIGVVPKRLFGSLQRSPAYAFHARVRKIRSKPN